VKAQKNQPPAMPRFEMAGGSLHGLAGPPAAAGGGLRSYKNQSAVYPTISAGSKYSEFTAKLAPE
jgi:hypothetical protein